MPNAKDTAEEEWSRRLPGQDTVAKFYNHVSIQVAVAILIAANFLTNIMEKEIDPEKDQDYPGVWQVLDTLFTVVFAVELGIHMYAEWFREFWCGPNKNWNIFDFVVVIVGVVNLEIFSFLGMPEELNLLRLMRAFRIFRLFNRVKSLKKIVHGILSAIPGVMNAFLILTIFMCIFAILSVELFRNIGEGPPDCKEPDAPEGYGTPRQGCLGEEYFGDFGKAFYTFFQVFTGESWSEMIARPVIWHYDIPFLNFLAASFFVVFFVITQYILANVVLALLTDKVCNTADEEEAKDEAPAQEPAEAPAGETEANMTASPPLPEGDKQIAKELGKLQGSLGELGSGAADLQSDFDRVKSDMAAMREQIGLLMNALEGRYRLAAL